MNRSYIIRNLFSGTILRIFLLIFSVIIAFFMMPFMIHSLGDTKYGLWVLIGTLTGYYGFLDFGLAAATQRYISKALGNNDFENMNIVINSSLTIYTYLGIGILAVSIVASAIIYYTASLEYSLELAISALILGASFAIQFPSRTFGGVLRSYVRQDIVIGVEIFSLIFRTVLIVYFISQGYGIIALSIISFLNITLSSFIEIIASYKVFNNLTLNKKFVERDTIKSLFNYSWVAFVANITEILKFKLSPIIVASVISVEAVVIYAVAFRLLEYFSQLFGNLVRMITPIFSQLEGRNDISKIKNSFIYSMVISIIATLFVGSNIIFFGYDFILLWMGEEYIASYYVLWITCISVTIWIMQAPSKELLFGTSNHRYYAMLSTLGLITTSMLSIMFGTLYGLYGLAAGLSIGILIPELIFPFVIKRVFDFDFKEIYVKTLFPVFIKTVLILGMVFSIMLTIDVQLTSYLNIFMWATVSTVSFSILSVFILPHVLKEKLYLIVSSRLPFFNRRIGNV